MKIKALALSGGDFLKCGVTCLSLIDLKNELALMQEIVTHPQFIHVKAGLKMSYSDFTLIENAYPKSKIYLTFVSTWSDEFYIRWGE